MNFLATLLEWLKDWWPFYKVAPWEEAVRFTYVPRYYSGFFKSVERPARVVQTDLKPGLHRRIPWLEEVKPSSVVEDTFEGMIQNITTKDGASVAFKVSIVYEIFNVKKATVEVHDYENSMHSLTMIHMARSARNRTWQELHTNQDDIERDMKKALHDESKRWGTRIKDVGITTLVKSHQVNRFQTNQ